MVQTHFAMKFRNPVSTVDILMEQDGEIILW